jgi:putative tryptophan/tyrosine transport system substrate-binding protein
VHKAADLHTMVAAISREQSCGVLVAPSSFFAEHQQEVIGLMARYGLPAVYGFRGQVERGGLLSYGVDGLQTSRNVASYVDRILRGEKPGDLPVTQPTKRAGDQPCMG